MPLLLLDLDNTLIDRAAAFRRWAVSFTAECAIRNGAEPTPGADVKWLIDADRDGLEPRDRLAASIQQRFGLEDRQQREILAELRGGLVENIELDPEVPAALDRARAAGWIPVVVTNGTVAQQERKLRHTGLAEHVAGWVISEGAGIRKPDPLIFRLAADQTGQSLAGAWVIGDSAEADIGGARNAGLPSVWLHRNRAWPHPDFAPTLTKDTCPQAITAIMTHVPAHLTEPGA